MFCRSGAGCVEASNAVDGCRWQIGEGASQAGGTQAKTAETAARNGAARAVGELVEDSIGAHVAESSAKDREHTLRRHDEQGKAANGGTSRSFAEEAVTVEATGVKLKDAGLGEALLKELGEIRAVFDECEVLFANALSKESAGKDARSGAKLDDVAGVAANLTGDEASESRAGGTDGADQRRVSGGGAQEGEPVIPLSLGPFDLRPLHAGTTLRKLE